MKPGMLMVVSGPAGVGKGTLVKELMENREQVVLSISATTRMPRPGETNGVQYWFKDRQEFESMIRTDQLLEWVEYCGNYYGTPMGYVKSRIAEGKVVILEIEVEGALRIRKLFPDSVLVFVLPPDMEKLEERLKGRGTETPEAIHRRMIRSAEEFFFLPQYDYFVINEDIGPATDALVRIIDVEQMRIARNPGIVNRFRTQ
jgi:guanylate kinase